MLLEPTTQTRGLLLAMKHRKYLGHRLHRDQPANSLCGLCELGGFEDWSGLFSLSVCFFPGQFQCKIIRGENASGVIFGLLGFFAQA